ncbi:MAG: hypothetical protein V1750_09330, partial [Acidobacteriota bacterium]
MRPGAVGALLTGLLALAMLVPVGPGVPAAPRSPVAAAQALEGQIPAVGLNWGRVRAWERVGEGWKITWQPAHGAWLLRSWLPDHGGPPPWRLEVAPWLPGARLSLPAAALLLE